MFIRWAGYPDILDGGGDMATIYDLEGISGSESEANEEEDKEEDLQEFPEGEAGQETPIAWSG